MDQTTPRNPNPTTEARPEREEGPARGGNTVVSLAAARSKPRLRANRRAPQRQPSTDALDLEGLDTARMTEGARELYWFNVNRYARRLFLAASDASIMSARTPYADISADHVQRAEEWRRRSERRSTKQFGLLFVLDALQLTAAALAGALATKPEFLDGTGPYPLLGAVTLTATIFLVREWLTASE